MGWVNEHRRLTLFAVVVLVQALLVIGVVVREERRLAGLEIVLESRPIDPRDPIRGDFVILSYVAEDLRGVPGDDVGMRAGVFVEFEDRGRYWEPVYVHRRLIPREDWRDGYAFVFARVTSLQPLRVEYPNLGYYFIPQGTGNPPTAPDVFVSVSDDGTARIKRLEIDGKRWPSETVSQDRVPPAPVNPSATAAATPVPVQ